MAVPGKENVRTAQTTAASSDKGKVKPALAPVANMKEVYIAVNATMPGRLLPVWRIGVDGNARLLEVVRGWAKNVLQKDFLVLPPGASVTGRFGDPALDLNATIQTIKPQLPISGGRPTVNVKWPADAGPVLAPGKAQPKASPKAKAEVKKVASLPPKVTKQAKVKPVKQDKTKKVKKEKKAKKEKKVKEKRVKEPKVKEKQTTTSTVTDGQPEQKRARAAPTDAEPVEPAEPEKVVKDASSSDSDSDSESSSDSSDDIVPDYLKKALESDDDLDCGSPMKSPIKSSPGKKRGSPAKKH